MSEDKNRQSALGSRQSAKAKATAKQNTGSFDSGFPHWRKRVGTLLRSEAVTFLVRFFRESGYKWIYE